LVGDRTGRHEQDAEMTTIRPTTTIASPAAKTADESAIADFVRRFETVWANPDPDALNGLVHADVEFIQPMEAPVHGHREAAAFWRRLFTLIPDIRGEVISWGRREDRVYIELRMMGTLGGKPIEWTTLDRILLEDGRVRQRIAYFNQVPLVLAVITRPRAWPAYLAAQRQRLSS
jgi:ketosteroid isomerase-like protein